MWAMLAFLAASTLCASAQPKSIVQAESLHAPGRIVIVDPGLSLGKAILLLPDYRPSDLVLGDQLYPFVHTYSPLPPPFLQGASVGQIDLIAPLRLQMQSEQELQTLRTILGAVGFSGAVYVAYRHVKKYGFWK